MRIYYKKRFYSGLLSLLLAVLNLVGCIQNGFTLKRTVLLVLLLLLGGETVRRSLSRKLSAEDRIADLDERNRLIELKSQSLAYRVLAGALYVLMLGCAVGYGCSRSMLWVSAFLAALLLWLVLLAVRIAGLIYFETHV